MYHHILLTLACATTAFGGVSQLGDVYSSTMNDTAGVSYACFRIPSLVKLSDGQLIAFAEGRRGSCADHGDVRIVSRSSSDGGKTWGRISQVLSEVGHTIGNPSPIADAGTGAIWLLYSRDNQQVFVTSSMDAGKTWSAPTNQTMQLKPNPDPSSWVATGPPGGVQLASGRLVTAAYYNRPDGGTRTFAIFSDDHGATWQRGADVGINNTPGQAVYMGGESQLVPFGGNGRGLAMLIRARTTVDDVSHNHALTFSRDGGATWENATRMSGIQTTYCEGSMAAADNGDLLVSSPSTPNGVRADLTVWSAPAAAAENFTKIVTLYSGSSAYSSMLSLSPQQAGHYINLYEREDSQYISLAQFTYP